VQGVGFRFYLAEAARLENVQGWVRDLPDGGVEAFVEGDRDASPASSARSGTDTHRGEVDLERFQVRFPFRIPGSVPISSVRFQVPGSIHGA
jgi:hypothetical protein